VRWGLTTLATPAGEAESGGSSAGPPKRGLEREECVPSASAEVVTLPDATAPVLLSTLVAWKTENSLCHRAIYRWRLQPRINDCTGRYYFGEASARIAIDGEDPPITLLALAGQAFQRERRSNLFIRNR
jgi:hypothetical protein